MHEFWGDMTIDAPRERRRNERDCDPHAQRHDALFTLARASELHDEDTGEHLQRIRLLVEQIALELGFDAEDARELGCDAMLHDVGKLHVAAHILKKPGALTPEEREIMRAHTVRGERLLSGRPSMHRAALIALNHHEAWDGSGYPHGLRGEETPLEARITTAADMLDALVSSRCYKEAWTFARAMDEVRSLSGTKLDPRVVEAIARCEQRGALQKVFRFQGMP